MNKGSYPPGMIGTNSTPDVLILPGMGGDHRMCDLMFPLPGQCVSVDYIPWKRSESLRDYSSRFLWTLQEQGVLVPSRLRCIIGVSLGGAIAIEIASQMATPPRLILVGSFLSTSELAWFARIFIRFIAPLLPAFLYRAAGSVLPFFMRRISRVQESDLGLLQDMYKNMPSHFLSRACAALARWRGAKHTEALIRIHGEDDHIIPLRISSEVDYRVKGARHLVSISHLQETRTILTGLVDDLL